MLKTILYSSLCGTLLLMAGCNSLPSKQQLQNIEQLQNKDWVLSYLGNTEFKATPDAHSVPSLRFEPTQQLTGSDGCNRLLGGYVVQGQTLQLSVASTKIFCEDPQQTTQNFNQRLAKVTGYQVHNQNLRLLDPHGNVLLQFQTNSPNP
ncbi:META domain-containing protein [Acinetobacter larvae]|uniref:DUF306 domain-containing protein n=1 Tax=Acinetobacter larvae TaxID=1789224 RepID=A0A1B2M2Q4_9GAMM|nr:META domain-containing protein [Acinetobacter larvae]AOA59421.1 hypothetical protein BFG52_14390 [Acinetobacter larvae]